MIVLRAEDTALFCSDQHLSGSPESAKSLEACFLAWLGRELSERQPQWLFLVGDLFEAWVGDDLLESDEGRAFQPSFEPLRQLLADYRAAGGQVIWIAGNRDFLLQERACKALGADARPQGVAVEHNRLGRIWVLHGDTLCTEDRAYQRFRWLSRRRTIQAIFLALPRRLRLAIARRLRAHSMAKYGSLSGASMPWADVTEQACDREFIQRKARTLIHGHTHRPGCHRHRRGMRWVLPDWRTEGDAVSGGGLWLGPQGLSWRVFSSDPDAARPSWAESAST